MTRTRKETASPNAKLAVIGKQAVLRAESLPYRVVSAPNVNGAHAPGLANNSPQLELVREWLGVRRLTLTRFVGPSAHV